MIHLQNTKLILGSKSPRRSQLLREAGLVFEIRTQDIDEDFDQNMPVLKVAEDLAVRKAAALKDTLAHNEVLITADSVVILEDTIYNKPADYAEGVSILSKLSGKKHTVATGVCLTSVTKKHSFTAITDIQFDVLTAEDIDYYLTAFEPYDKAGSYGIQDWIGLCKVISIQGSHSNIMGLPMQALYSELAIFLQ
jgi:septum formation protein